MKGLLITQDNKYQIWLPIISIQINTINRDSSLFYQKYIYIKILLYLVTITIKLYTTKQQLSFIEEF